MMFLIGGTDGVANVNDVWRSVDGVSWSAVTDAAGFAVRRNHQAVSFGGEFVGDCGLCGESETAEFQ